MGIRALFFKTILERTCKECDGIGYQSSVEFEKYECPGCKGEGFILDEELMSLNDLRILLKEVSRE